MNIQQKIVAPFAALIVSAMLVAALVSIALESRTLGTHVQEQASHVATMLAQTGFALNSSILDKVKLMIGAEVVTFRADGVVVADTSGGAIGPGLVRLPETTATVRRLLDQHEPAVVTEVQYEGAPYAVAYRRIESAPDTVVAVAIPTSDIDRTVRPVARTIAAVAALLVATTVLLSHRIARSITLPLTRLVALTKDVAAGHRTRQSAVAGDDEVGALGAAFDDMVQRLRTSERELLDSEKLALTGQLAARVAHDVRTPLSSLKMSAQLLRTKLQPGRENAELLEGLLRDIDRVESVVAGLLDLSRPFELRVEIDDVNTGVEAALRSMEAQLRHRKIAVRRDLAPGLPPVEIDVHRFAAALVNLIANAADAMPDGGTLTAVTRPLDAGARVAVEIRDDGCGIDPATHDRLFDPFFSTKREGVGLGLVNTRTIVERHGGAVELRSNDGGGTCAVITLAALAATQEEAV